MKIVMCRLFLLLSFLFVSVCSNAQIEEILGFNMPESVALGKRYMYVSNVGGNPIPAAGSTDGYISKLDKAGKVVNQKFITSLKAPKGLLILGDYIWVADVDHLLGFDVSIGKKVFDISFEGKSQFLNDIAAKNDSLLFVSTTDIGKVFLVNIKRKTYEALDIEKIKGANGLAYDKSRNILYVCGFGDDNKPNGQLGKITFYKNKPLYSVLNDDSGHFDGLSLIGNTLLYSDWTKMDKSGVLKKFNLQNQTFNTIFMKEKLGGPADFFYDSIRKMIILPLMLENKLIIIKL